MQVELNNKTLVIDEINATLRDFNLTMVIQFILTDVGWVYL